MDQKDWVFALPDLASLVEKLELENEMANFQLLLDDFEVCPKTIHHKDHLLEMFYDLKRLYAWVQVLHSNYRVQVLPEEHLLRIDHERRYLKALRLYAVTNEIYRIDHEPAEVSGNEPSAPA